AGVGALRGPRQASERKGTPARCASLCAQGGPAEGLVLTREGGRAGELNPRGAADHSLGDRNFETKWDTKMKKKSTKWSEEVRREGSNSRSNRPKRKVKKDLGFQERGLRPSDPDTTASRRSYRVAVPSVQGAVRQRRTCRRVSQNARYSAHAPASSGTPRSSSRPVVRSSHRSACWRAS